MSHAITHLVLRKKAVESDWKLGEPTSGNNGRKVMVTNIWPAGEAPVADPEWRPAPRDGHTPVLENESGGTEIATFTEDAAQDRHMHRISTEIYTVLQGRLQILLNDEGPVELEAGDEIVILPGTVHQIVREGPERIEARLSGHDFQMIVRVHALQCHGGADKYVQLERDGPWLIWRDLAAQDRRRVYNR